MVKDKGFAYFIIDILESDEIRTLYDRKWYPEAFYLLAMLDYVSRKNDVPLCTRYNDLRAQKLKEIIYPADVILSDLVSKNDRHKNEAMEKAIPEFLRFNIVECEVENVY